MVQSSVLVTLAAVIVWGIGLAMAIGTGSYRIRSRPPNTGQHRQSQAVGTANRQQQRNWQDVYIAGFFALSDHEIEAALGQGVMPAINLALRHLTNSSFLHDYRLRLLHNDTQCSAAVGMKAFFDMMDKEPRKVMILGGSCTSVTDSIAKTSKHWRLPVLSYADTHPMFTQKGYPNFFRIVPSENAFNAPRIKLLQAFNWTRVGTLYQNEPRFALAHNGLLSLLDAADIEVAESQGFVNDLTVPLAKLAEKDVRIILASFNATWARRVFCAVSRTNLYGGRYQWIIAGPRQERWWREEDPTVSCTSYEILAALEGAFVVDVLPLTSSKQVTISGLTAQEYEAQYDRERGDSYSQFHGYAYDAIWTAAITVKSVVHQLHERNRHSGGGKAHHWSLNDFNYRDAGWEKLFLDALRNVNFNGVTGRIKFEDNERSGRLTVKQIVGAHEVPVAEYENASDTLFLNESAISWMSESNLPPRDRTIQIVEPSRISIPVFATLTIVAALGIVLASSFLAINIRFRNQRYIKMSSPYLNNMIIIGCLLTYTSVILLGLDSHLTSESALPVICTARIWTLMAGFTLAFGSMFSKTWRVHSIFTDVKLNKKAIKDYKLFMVVGVLLTIDIAILLTWQIIDPFYRETKLLDPYMHPSQDNVEIQPENEFCQSNHMTIFVGSIYAYKGLLMAFGCFLAWETRNVNIPALNDSKYIGMSVYNVVIMCVIGGAVSFILADEQDVSYVIISIFIIFCTTGTLCLVFVPKLIELKRNPQGTIEKRARATVKPQLPTSKYSGAKGSGGVGGQNRENSLHHKSKTRNAKLRRELRNLDDQIQKLLEQLGDDNDSLAKDGPSFSCRVPSVSGADTISLSSLVSSPEPTSTSPHHARENGGKSVKVMVLTRQTSNSAVGDVPSPALPSASSGSGNGSDSTAQAMWTAIGNPLMLISNVLSKSMEFQQSGSAATPNAEGDAEASSLPTVATAPSCEYVSVEQHPEPTTDWIHPSLEEEDEEEDDNSTSPSVKDETARRKQQTPSCCHCSAPGSFPNLLERTSSLEHCSCYHQSHPEHHHRLVCESFSLTEIRTTPLPDGHRDNIHRSLSVEGNLMSGLVLEHSRSDSSLNHESNLSELVDGQSSSVRAPVNYFEYRSLESLDSNSTISRSMATEEADSTRVNFDESSTFNSPKDELEDTVAHLYALNALNHRLANGGEAVLRDTPRTPSTTPVPVKSPIQTSTNKSSTRGARKCKSHSTRERRRGHKAVKEAHKKPVVSYEDISRGDDNCQNHHDCPQSVMQRQDRHDGILPIFKQLIVQKQLESHAVAARSQPLNSIATDAASTSEGDFEDRQMSSCPNLSIKCDVVEYI